MHAEVGYTNEDGSLISKRFELVRERRNSRVEFGAVCQESGCEVVVSQSVLIELNVVFFQWGVLVFRIPNWFRGHWYRVHREEVRRFGIARGSFEGSGFGLRFELGFKFGFEFGFGFGFGIGFGFAGRIV
jgi:hypothetical protein